MTRGVRGTWHVGHLRSEQPLSFFVSSTNVSSQSSTSKDDPKSDETTGELLEADVYSQLGLWFTLLGREAVDGDDAVDGFHG